MGKRKPSRLRTCVAQMHSCGTQTTGEVVSPAELEVPADAPGADHIGASTRSIVFQLDPDSGDVKLRVPALMPRLQTNFADGADSGDTQLLSFLLAGGPLRAPFSDGAVLTWLKTRGVDPLTAACTAEGEQVDGLSGSHVRMALEALKVCDWLNDKAGMETIVKDLCTHLVEAAFDPSPDPRPNELLHVGLQNMLQLSSSPGLAHAAKSILRCAAAALGEPGALLERLPAALHAEARMQFLAHSGRLTDVRSVRLVVGKDSAFSDCSKALTKQLTNLQACTSLEFKYLANVGSWGGSSVRHWDSQLATLKNVVYADLQIGTSPAFRDVVGALAAVGTDMLQNLSFRLVSAAFATDQPEVEAVLKQARFLRQLSLQWSAKSDARFERLPPLISRLRYLQSLELRDLWYCAASPHEMFPPSLTRLVLDCWLASKSTCQDLMIALGSCSRLRDLRLTAINFADCGFVPNAKVPHLPLLRRLEVAGGRGHQLPALLAVRVVRECPPELQHLRLSQVPLGSAECMKELCEELAGGLRDKAAELRHLELSDCGLDVSEVREWCSTLRAMSQLTALHVAQNGFSPKQKCYIAATVANLKTLRELSL